MTNPASAPVSLWDIIKSDMDAREVIGLERYGHMLDPHDGRDWLEEAYFEALDQVIYIRAALYKRDGK